MLIDAFMFFNELELLEIRLHEMNSIADYFVIAESLERHGSSEPKKAFIQDNWNIVKPFEKKIKYILLPHLEPPFTDASSGWKRENHQRNVLMNYVSELSTNPDKDILIVSDADEIPRASTIRRDYSAFSKGLCRLELDLYFYNVNRFVGLSCDGAGFPTIGPVSHFQRELEKTRQFAKDRVSVGLSAIRGGEYPKIQNGGWHFSYFGGIDRMREKTASFAEAYLDQAAAFRSKTDAEIAADISAGEDIYHRGIYRPFTRRPSNDPHLPWYFLQNIGRYRHFIES